MKSNKTLAYYNTNTITFLREADRDKLSTIGHVFGNEKLQKNFLNMTERTSSG